MEKICRHETLVQIPKTRFKELVKIMMEADSDV